MSAREPVLEVEVQAVEVQAVEVQAVVVMAVAPALALASMKTARTTSQAPVMALALALELLMDLEVEVLEVVQTMARVPAPVVTKTLAHAQPPCRDP